MNTWLRGWCVLACMGLACAAVAQDDPAATEASGDALTESTVQPLPSPLTLEAALKIADESHPELMLARSSRQRAEAKVRESLVENGLDITANLRPQQVRPALETPPEGDWVGDNVWSLAASKRLYDFGRSGALKKAGKSSIDAADLALADVRRRFDTEVMAAFFQVLLADSEAQREDETMSMTYVRYDKLRDRHALGEVSDVDLLAAESDYRNRLAERNAARSEQTLARVELANLLNHPGELPPDLAMPNLPDIVRPVPEYKAVLALLLRNNPTLQQRKDELAAAEQALKAAKAKRFPVLSAQLSVADWEREFGSRNNAEAMLNLEIPLYQGGEAAAAITGARANLTEAKANLRAAELALYEDAMRLTEAIRNLSNKREATKVQLDYRDLYLERSRALYEMEAKTDLGDAMVQLSDAQLKVMETDFALQLAWKELENLNGGGLPELPAEEGDGDVQ